MKRLFVAIKIIPDEQFLSVYHALKKEMVLDTLKWVEPHNFHLTLKFIGNTSSERIPVLVKALKEVSKRYEPFTFSLEKTGLFGSSYRPRILWFGSENPSETLISLGEDVLETLDKAGFLRDRQNFVPHLTVARIKQIVRKEAFQETIQKHQNGFIQKVEVNQIYLYESILRPEGPLYKVVETFSLTSKS
ncbi:MAG: RNA 2',3'-cyclic phosphodiesterase [Bacteroidales bacterium]|nr:RNA 2',3'-cyclic phosphodiesterase [Bacteroidales bacterium]